MPNTIPRAAAAFFALALCSSPGHAQACKSPVYTLTFAAGGAVEGTTECLDQPEKGPVVPDGARLTPVDEHPPSERDRLHPTLQTLGTLIEDYRPSQAYVTMGSPQDEEETKGYVLRLAPPYRLSERFPEPGDQAGESFETAWREASGRVKQLSQDFAPELQGLGEVVQVYPFVNAVLVEVPVSRTKDFLEMVERNAKQPDAYTPDQPIVYYAEPESGGALRKRLLAGSAGVLGVPTPLGLLDECTSEDGNDLRDGRKVLGSSSWPLDELPPGRIALIDSGVAHDHPFFSQDTFGRRLDCRDSDWNTSCRDPAFPTPECICAPPEPDPSDGHDYHGTASAAILAATGDHDGDDAYDGMTRDVVDSFKASDFEFRLGDLLTALLAALASRDKIILVEADHDSSPLGALSVLADVAYDTGAVVVAPIGNTTYAYGKNTRSPANAHKVLGIGGYRLRALAKALFPPASRAGDDNPPKPPTPISAAVGPVIDGRVKPDLMAPTEAESAQASRHRHCAIYGGTSGAAPWAAGAAALWRGLLKHELKIVPQPGLVYAAMILSGMPSSTANLCREHGQRPPVAPGLIQMPVCGEVKLGYLDLDEVDPQGKTVVKIPLAKLKKKDKPEWIDAALWWPESVETCHRDLDLGLRRGSDPMATSNLQYSVFERARSVPGNDFTGKWSLEIIPRPLECEDNGAGVEKRLVYWAVYFARPC